MLGAMASAKSQGIDVGPFDQWSRDDSFDVVHAWGLHPQHENAIGWARLAKKRIVLSVLIGYATSVTELRRRIGAIFNVNAWRERTLGLVDAVTVVNEGQAISLEALGVSKDRIFVIPNIVSEPFFAENSLTADSPTRLADYVLTTGNICPRKNQLALVRACRKLNVPLLLIGEVLTGETTYADAIAHEIAGVGNIEWIRHLPPASAQLAIAYKNASLFALPSFQETQPISALEAVATGLPLLLANRTYAKQKQFENAGLVEPESVSSIAATIRKILESRNTFRSPRESVESCRLASVGASYAALYRSICNQNS